MQNQNFVTINGQQINVTTVFDKNIVYIPTREECFTAVERAEGLLNEYFDDVFDHYYQNDGLHMMFDQGGMYWTAKGWLIRAMQKHPAYNGNMQIVLRDQDMCRRINWDDIQAFRDYVSKWVSSQEYFLIRGRKMSRAERIAYRRKLNRAYAKADRLGLTTLMEKLEKWNRESLVESVSIPVNNFFRDLVWYIIDKLPYVVGDDDLSDVLLTEDMADTITEITKEYGVKFRVSKGQKVTRVIAKAARLTEIINHVDMQWKRWYTTNPETGESVYHEREYDAGWNQQYSAFADALSPLPLKGTFVMSVNYYDYWTMSFGKNWASCHTIDKANLRGADHSYSGMYCAGTQSYMCDDCSVICYYLPQGWNGNRPELDDKLKRCVFYIGEDKIIQGRVYPDGRDGGDAGVASDMRRIMQKLVSELWEVPNYWKNVKGTEACCEVADSIGSHYRDYECYDDCNVSYLKRIDGYKNENRILIGSRHVCPVCGITHSNHENIFCSRHSMQLVECYRCGDSIEIENAREINGDYYCSDCVAVCDRCDDLENIDNITTDTNDGRCLCEWCRSNYYTWSNEQDIYINDGDIVETEEGAVYDRNNEDYYDEWGECDNCNNVHNRYALYYDEETDQDLCRDCYDELMEERENAEEEEENDDDPAA